MPDLSVDDMPAPSDMAKDLGPSIDFAIPDGNHLGHVTWTGGAATDVKEGSSHQVTFTVGEPATGTAVGTFHTIQFSVPRAARSL